VSLAIAGLWLWAGGTPLGGPAKAAHMLADLHPWLSAALPHAAIAGVCLFLAGIVSGYYDNRCVYARVPQRLARHPGLNRLLGPARSAALARYVEDNLGAIAGNVAFGLMLGFVGFGGTILGLPLDIRHVTFAAANLAYGSVGLDWQIAPLEFAIAALGVGLIGLVNLVVSFALAFATAMKARGLRVRQFGAYARVLAARMRREPRSFVLPPPEAPR
jgi:site-specific recombinase